MEDCPNAKYTITFEASSPEMAAETMEGIVRVLRLDGTPENLQKPDHFDVLHEGDCIGQWSYRPLLNLVNS